MSSEEIDGFETISSRFEPLRSFDSALSRLSSQAGLQGQLALQFEVTHRSRAEQAEAAIKVCKLLQSLQEKWSAADHAAKRQILSIVLLKFSLNDLSLFCEMRKPFALLREGLLVSSSRVDKTAIELFIVGVRGWEAGLPRQRVQE
jgi:hypothetical protein